MSSDLSDARTVKGNLYELFRSFQRARSAEFSQRDKLIRWGMNLAHPWFNAVLALQPAGEDEQALIQETVAYFRSRETQLFTWWVENDLYLEGWSRQLLAHGFHRDANTPGMVVELGSLNEALSFPAGFEVLPVCDRATLECWAEVMIEGYELPVTWTAGLFELTWELGLDLPSHHFLGYLDGRPVATSSLFLGAGAAGIYYVGVVPLARGRGIGAAITLAPLLEARQMGYRLGVLQSSEMGHQVYLRLGFKDVCRMEHFYWRDPGVLN